MEFKFEDIEEILRASELPVTITNCNTTAHITSVPGFKVTGYAKTTLDRLKFTLSNFFPDFKFKKLEDVDFGYIQKVQITKEESVEVTIPRSRYPTVTGLKSRYMHANYKTSEIRIDAQNNATVDLIPVSVEVGNKHYTCRIMNILEFKDYLIGEVLGNRVLVLKDSKALFTNNGLWIDLENVSFKKDCSANEVLTRLQKVPNPKLHAVSVTDAYDLDTVDFNHLERCPLIYTHIFDNALTELGKTVDFEAVPCFIRNREDFVKTIKLHNGEIMFIVHSTLPERKQKPFRPNFLEIKRPKRYFKDSLVSKGHVIVSGLDGVDFIQHEFKGDTFLTFLNVGMNYRQMEIDCSSNLTTREMEIITLNTELTDAFSFYIEQGDRLDAIRYFEGYMSFHISCKDGKNVVSYLVPNQTFDKTNAFASLTHILQTTLDSTDLQVLREMCID